MEKVTVDMKSNKMAINPDKAMIMLITKDKAAKKAFTIEIGGKVIKHSPQVTVLGNVISDTLTWDAHVSRALLPALTNRLELSNSFQNTSVQSLRKFMPAQFSNPNLWLV